MNQNFCKIILLRA